MSCWRSERLIYAYVELTIDITPAGTSRLLTQEIEHRSDHLQVAQDINDSFSAKNTGAVFVDLTAGYNTVWHHSLTCKLLQLLPDRHMVCMIMELVGFHSFNLAIGNSKQSRLRHLRNDGPQESILAHLLYNIYTSDLLTTISRKYAYTNNLAIMLMETGKQGKELMEIGKQWNAY